jgi:hypothetical protein
MMKKTVGLTELSLEKIYIPPLIIKSPKKKPLLFCFLKTTCGGVLPGGDFSG